MSLGQAIIDVLAAGAPVFPVLDVTWTVRGETGLIPPGRYGKAGTILEGRPVSGVVPHGGFKEIVYGPGLKGSTLAPTRTSVTVIDEDRTLARQLETFDPRGSPALIRWGSPDLVEADWGLLFTGIVEDWKASPGLIDILVKTDDSALASPCPKPVFSKSDWYGSNDPTIFGSTMPLVLGHHSSFEITARGMVPGVSIRYDAILGFWWMTSVGNLLIDRVYFDGFQQLDAVFVTVRGTFGGSRMTTIQVPEASKPNIGVVVSFDGSGPDDTGAVSGPTMNNPVQQLRTVLQEYVFRNNTTGVYAGADPHIDDPSWMFCQTYFGDRGYESGVLIGAERDNPTGSDIIESFLDPYPWVRMFWTPEGTIAMTIIDHTDFDPPETSNWSRPDIYTPKADFKYQPGDRREVFDHVTVPFLWSGAEQKFLSEYQAHDLTLRYQQSTLSVPNRWSQGRYLNV